MIAWQIIKLFASRLAGFIMKHWRIILPLLVLWYCYSQYSAQVARADRAEVALAQFKADIAQATFKRSAENATKLAVAKKALQESEKQHGAVIAKFNLDRERETKNLKAYYENRIDSTKFNFTERMRLEAERHRIGMSEVTGDSSRLTERERECYAGYSTLEKACQLTTSDYNRLRGWANVACEQVGCE
jgi:hypothetical protein